MARVVVGVDTSPQSLEALEIAAHEARWRSATLEVVYVFRPSGAHDNPALGAATAGGALLALGAAGAPMVRDAFELTAEQLEEARQKARIRLERLVDEAGDALGGVSQRYTIVTEEHPAHALVRISQNADLLVVGSRGLGGFKGVLLGSVSLQCVLHANVPVLVVRPRAHGTPVQ